MQYLCAICTMQSHCAKEPESDNLALRILHLYILISAEDGELSPLRMRPVSVVLEPPPDAWAWGVNPEEISDYYDCAPAKPRLIRNDKGKHWQYSADESKAIWCAAGSFRGEETPGSASASNSAPGTPGSASAWNSEKPFLETID